MRRHAGCGTIARVSFGIFDEPWRILALAGWCFLMAWGFRIGLLRMALSLGVITLLTAVAWVTRNATTPALLYAPLAFIGVISVISIGVLGRHWERRLGYDSTKVRINHAGGLLLGLIIGGALWVVFF